MVGETGYAARVIPYEGAKLVNICDAELLGQTVRGDGLEMKITREYYCDGIVSEEKALQLVSDGSIVNLAGARIVSKVVKAQLASEKATRIVGSVPFLMIYKFMG